MGKENRLVCMWVSEWENKSASRWVSRKISW